MTTIVRIDIVRGPIANLVLTNPGVGLVEGVIIEGMEHLGRDIETNHRLPLVLRKRVLIVGVGRLEPGRAQARIQLQASLVGRLVIQTLDKVFGIAVGMEHSDLRRVEKAAAVHGIDSSERTESDCSESEMGTPGGSGKCAAAQGHSAVRCALVEIRPRLRHNDHTRLGAYVGSRRSLADFHGLESIQQNLR